jgi:CelD/BcsL family acetyltransferase involved in cellulose biosynthesis
MAPWWNHLFGGGEMWTIAIWENDRLIGLAPLFIHGIDAHEVSFLGSGVTDYLDFLVDDQNAAQAAQEICGHIRRSAHRWNCCNLVEIPADSPLLEVALSSKFGEKSPAGVCPVVPLPHCLEALESTLSPKFHHHLRNSRNRLRDLGASFETSLPGQDSEYVDALIRLHTSRWQSRGEAGVLATASVQNFLHDLAPGFRARGWLRFHGLRYQGELHGAVCIFCAHERCHYYLGGFDDRFARFGPGNLLIRFAMEQAIHEHAREFDFLRNGESYKYKWGARDRVNWKLIVDQESSAGFR